MAALVVVTIRTSGGFKIMSFDVHSTYARWKAEQ